MAIREGRWECTHCGSTRIRGDDARCPECGTPRPAGAPARRARRRLRTGLLLAAAAACLLPATLAVTKARAKARRNEVLPAVVDSLDWERRIFAPVLKTWEEQSWSVPASGVVIREERRVVRHERRLVRTDTVWREVPRYEEVRVGTDTVRRQLGEEVRVGAEAPETRTRWETELRPRYERRAVGTERRMELVPVHADVPVYGTWYTYTLSRLDTLELWEHGPRDSVPRWPALPAGADTAGPVERLERYGIRLTDARGRRGYAVAPQEVWASSFRPGQRIAVRNGYGVRAHILPRDSLPGCVAWHAGRSGPPPDTLGCTPLPAERLP